MPVRQTCGDPRGMQMVPGSDTGDLLQAERCIFQKAQNRGKESCGLQQFKESLVQVRDS